MKPFDLVIIVGYLVGMVIVGILARGKKDDAEDYFTAKGTLNTWFSTVVVGLSIAGTFFSGISFIAYPSVVYAHGIQIVFGLIFICMPVSYFVLRYWFLPRYLAGGWKYPYDIVEHRFGAATRTVVASLYILMRIGWMAAMIYAPTIAIMTMGRLDAKWFWPIVLVTGLSNTLYTVISGVRGVIVTEAIQMIVIMLGIAATIITAWTQIPVSFDVALTHLWESGRLNVTNFSIDPTIGLTFWTVAIGVTVANLSNYIGDQMSLQRYLATGDVRAASRSFAVNVIGVFIVVVLLALVGLSLFVYYAFVPDPTLPTNADEVFPHFVANGLPMGVAGLMLAALLAATSIPSGINTLAGVLTLDFHARFKRNMTEAQRAFWGRVYSLLIGLAATFSAGIVARAGQLFDVAQILLGVFAGPLLSCIVVAVAGWRCAPTAMLIGIFVGWASGIGFAFSPVASLWVAPVSAGVTLAVAMLLSLFLVADRPEENPAIPLPLPVE